VQQRGARVDPAARAGEHPGDRQVDRRADQRDQHHSRTRDRNRRQQARDGLHHDPDYERQHRERVGEGSQHLGARIGLLTAMRQSQLQANTDPLTGLLNRRSLEDEVRTLTRDDRAFALVLADLDNFKALNDMHGHDAGDRALRIFARILRDTLREGDLLCRYGGEEFLLVLPGLTADEAASAFDRVRLEIDTAAAGGQMPLFTVSAGVVDTDDGATLSELVTIADRCLMQAKADGRDRVVTGLSS
jgi:diguanylate cyclase (GGDEF)-like protein